MGSDATLVAVGVAFLVFFIARLRRKLGANPAGLPYPPGPRPRPIIGNDLPTKRACITYAEWGKQYNSDILHAQVLGQHFIILNAHQDAVELFEKRSGIYSDRPAVPMIDLLGWGFNAAVMRYGDRWRLHRRVFQQGFRKSESAIYHCVQKRKIRGLLQDLLKTPEDFMKHYRNLAASIILATVYGHDVSGPDDRLVELAEHTAKAFLQAHLPGEYLVNTLPIFRHVPSWFPGAGFQDFAWACKQSLKEMKDIPFDAVREKVNSGTVETLSFLSRMLEKHDELRGSDYEANAIKEVAATAYAAGADTTAATLSVFAHAMALYPRVQKKAQEEIDRVIGSGRLPDHADRVSLPYVEALYREVLRWRPVAPLSVPHAASDNDIYRGYFIPKGSIVISNIWAITHDDRVYPSPEFFRPERFFGQNGKLNGDDMSAAFGYGRRICPGRHLGDSGVWLSIASILSIFNITKAHEPNGREIEIKDVYSDGLISHPAPFQCSITPRSTRARRLVENAN